MVRSPVEYEPKTTVGNHINTPDRYNLETFTDSHAQTMQMMCFQIQSKCQRLLSSIFFDFQVANGFVESLNMFIIYNFWPAYQVIF